MSVKSFSILVFVLIIGASLCSGSFEHSLATWQAICRKLMQYCTVKHKLCVAIEGKQATQYIGISQKNCEKYKDF